MRKLSEWTREDRQLLAALLFLMLVVLAIIAKAYAGDRALPPPFHRLPPPLLKAHGWELIAQPFDAVSGSSVGHPYRIRCNGNTDYMNGALKSPKDCMNGGLYRTLEECSKAQTGRVAPVRNEGTRWIGTVWFCRHKSPGGVV